MDTTGTDSDFTRAGSVTRPVRRVWAGVAWALLTLGWSCASEPAVPRECEAHPLYPALEEAQDGRLPVLVTLAVQGGENMEAIREVVLGDLDGTDFLLHRRFQTPPELALRVGEDAFCRLVTHDRVSRVERDRLAVPHG